MGCLFVSRIQTRWQVLFMCFVCVLQRLRRSKCANGDQGRSYLRGCVRRIVFTFLILISHRTITARFALYPFRFYRERRSKGSSKNLWWKRWKSSLHSALLRRGTPKWANRERDNKCPIPPCSIELLKATNYMARARSLIVLNQD